MNKSIFTHFSSTSWFTRLTCIAATLVLCACVTPTQYSEKALCDEQKRLKTQQSPSQLPQTDKELQAQTLQDCHYFSSTMPYKRSTARANYLWVKEVNTNKPQSTSHQLTQQMSNISDDISLSTGDQLMIKILNGEDFNAEVEVDANGDIYLPYLPRIQAQGLSLPELNLAIEQTLETEQLMLKGTIRISIMPLKWAPIEINVSGAVYEPGQHLINRKSVMELQDDTRLHSGDQAIERTISAALRSSGGIRPDADISQISVIREGKKRTFDMRGVFDGSPVPHITLAAGDRIHVPSSQVFNDELVRPSQITAPGIRVFISNLTQPASSNSQSAVDTEATRFPYGTRLLSGAIAANCVGGAQTTNASRHILLVTKNPLSNEMDVIERSLDKLIGQAWQTDFNPVLLPGDGIACYDSRVTNIREIARSLTEVLIPAGLLNWL